ncbi:hypothetical protein DUI87_12787 [Hirundo rustica rustica]|uniref:Uncharacterized protein n=1 Tax=Hirundo rustica rustica TaxID=333673 RepID=A0A3M0KS83_HIRRU|nr:hypothetical protein DUI87_12787 [Hirundo rustica rustica]
MLCLMSPRTELARLAARALLTHVQLAMDQATRSLSTELLSIISLLLDSYQEFAGEYNGFRLERAAANILILFEYMAVDS